MEREPQGRADDAEQEDERREDVVDDEQAERIVPDTQLRWLSEEARNLPSAVEGGYTAGG